MVHLNDGLYHVCVCVYVDMSVESFFNELAFSLGGFPKDCGFLSEMSLLAALITSLRLSISLPLLPLLLAPSLLISLLSLADGAHGPSLKISERRHGV